MENTIKSYQPLIKRLKNTSPVLEQPEVLTQSILEQIERIEVNRLPRNRVLHIIGLISGAAALLLLVLLIRITVRPPISFSVETGVTLVSSEQTSATAFRKIKEITKDKSVSERKEIIATVFQDKMTMNHRKAQLYRLTETNKINN